MGAEAFAERARLELLAIGEHARKRSVKTGDELTPQEAQIARLASEGASNQQIAAQLFIGPRTTCFASSASILGSQESSSAALKRRSSSDTSDSS